MTIDASRSEIMLAQKNTIRRREPAPSVILRDEFRVIAIERLNGENVCQPDY